MRKATQKASVSGPAPNELAIRTSRIRPVMRENSVKLLMVAADLSKLMAWGLLFWTHADGAVQAYGFAVQHVVRDYAVDQLGIVFGPPQAWREGNAGRQGVLPQIGRATSRVRVCNYV